MVILRAFADCVGLIPSRPEHEPEAVVLPRHQRAQSREEFGKTYELAGCKSLSTASLPGTLQSIPATPRIPSPRRVASAVQR
jgi:hypothetical protein